MGLGAWARRLRVDTLIVGDGIAADDMLSSDWRVNRPVDIKGVVGALV